MSNQGSLMKNTKRLAVAAMLTAISIVIGMICKNHLNFFAGILRVTFENLPIIAAGIMLGPVVGGTVGLCSDVVSYCLSAQAYPIIPTVTLGAVLVGVVSGVVAKYIIKKMGIWQITLSATLAHVVGSMVIKSIGLYDYYGAAVLLRIPLYAVIAAAEIAVLYILFRNPAIAQLAYDLGDHGCGCKSNATSKGFTYEDALSYIHSVSWKGSRPGLERTSELLGRIGDPQKKLKFIHVAGTNGKGSFCAMCDSVLRAAGYKVGLYTSPFVLRFNERMKVDGGEIPDKTLAEITEFVRPFADEMKDSPTEFELITVIALEYFAREGCDVVVLECGMGGRLDSTNVIDAPMLSVITGISLDHTAFLGSTISEIAREKAGIIKENAPVLLCTDVADAVSVISEIALEKGSPLYSACDREITVKTRSLEGTTFDCGDMTDIRIPLLGSYQPYNTRNLLCAIDILREQGMNISEDAVRVGLSGTVWHARFELLSSDPIFIADGGHNPEGIDAAVQSIKEYLESKKIIFVTGVMADKDYRYMAGRMSEVASHAFCVTPDNPRALAADEYCKVFEELGVDATPCDTVEIAVRQAIETARKENAAVVCLGSLYMYGEVHAAIKRQ